MENIKCVVIGSGGVGKTSMLITYVNKAFPEEYMPTVFDNYNARVKRRDVDEIVNLGLWDTGGGEDYHMLRPLSYPETDVFVLLFSIDSIQSAKNVVNEFIPEVRETGMLSEDVPIILVGSKVDLRDSKKEDDDSSEENKFILTPSMGKKLAMMVNANIYLEISSKRNAEGLENVFQEAIRQVLDGGSMLPSETDKKKKKKKKKSAGSTGPFGILHMIFGSGGGGGKKKRKKSKKELMKLREEEKKYLHSKYQNEIRTDAQQEVERLKKIMVEEIEEGRKSRSVFDGISNDVKLHILRHFVLLSYTQGSYDDRRWIGNKVKNPSNLFELRPEFHFFRDELGLGRENIILKCFGYFAEDRDRKNRNIHQIFFNFMVDSENDRVVKKFGDHVVTYKDYTGIEHLPRRKEKLITRDYSVTYKNCFREEIRSLELDVSSVKIFDVWRDRVAKSGNQCEFLVLKCIDRYRDAPKHTFIANIFSSLNEKFPYLRSLEIRFRTFGGFYTNPDPESSDFYKHGYKFHPDLSHLETLTLVGEAVHNELRISKDSLPSLKVLNLVAPRLDTHGRKTLNFYPERYFEMKSIGNILEIVGLQKVFLESLEFCSVENGEKLMKLIGEHLSIREVHLVDCLFEKIGCWESCCVQNEIRSLTIIDCRPIGKLKKIINNEEEEGEGDEEVEKGVMVNQSFMEMMEEKRRERSNFSYLIVQGSEVVGSYDDEKEIERLKNCRYLKGFR